MAETIRMTVFCSREGHAEMSVDAAAGVAATIDR